MNTTLKSDLYRYGKLSGIRGFLRGWLIPGFRYTWFMRKAQASHSILKLYYEWRLRQLSYKYGFQISSATQIGRGFYLGHFGSVVINKRAKIGKYCNIAHGVTIGQNNRGRRKGNPTLGDYVWVGTGAVIVGNVRVGNNVFIAPNTFVNFDIPDNSLVIGNPGKVVPRLNATEGYINHVHEDYRGRVRSNLKDLVPQQIYQTVD